MVQFYVSPDKNPAQIRREILAKEFQKALGQLTPKEIWCKRATGTLLVDRRRLVTNHIVDESSARLDWNDYKLIECGFDRARVELLFKQICDGGSSP